MVFYKNKHGLAARQVCEGIGIGCVDGAVPRPITWGGQKTGVMSRYM